MGKKGQSLIELLIAVGIFAISVSILVFFILDSYVSDRLGREITIANFLAQEGIEAVKSIRDYDWDQLISGNHGLVISETENVWTLTSPPAGTDVSEFLKEGERIIIIEDVGADRKKITSKISWQFGEGRTQEVELATHLTNWAKSLPPYLAQLRYRWRNDDGGE